MRREESHYGDKELVLIYIAKRLNEAKRVEKLLDEAGLDYLVEPDKYRGGVLFVRELVGAFFYVEEPVEAAAGEVLLGAGLKPYEPGG
jgi:hypothetical protein